MIDKDAALNWAYNSVGNEVGQFIGGIIAAPAARYLNQLAASLDKPNSGMPAAGPGGGEDLVLSGAASRSKTDGGKNLTWDAQRNTFVDDFGNPVSVQPMYADSGQIVSDASGVAATEPVGQSIDQGVSTPSQYQVKKGDSLWKIAKGQLGPNASDAEILQQTQILMELNPGLDPRALKIGKDINLVVPGSGIEVSADTRGAYAASDAEYQGYLADERAQRQEAMAGTNIIGDDGMRIGPTLERAQKEGLLQNTNEFDLLSPLEALSASTLYGEAAIKAGFQIPKALEDQRAGFRTELVMEADGSPRLGGQGQEKIKVFGPNAVLEGRDLPGTFRYADADNAKHLAAKGLQTKVGVGLLDDIHVGKLGGALNVAGAVLETAPDVVKYNRGEISGSELAGSITENVVEVGAVSVGTTLATVATVALIGAGTVATAPVALTVGIGIGIGFAIGAAYDYFLEDRVKNGATKLWTRE